MQFKMTHKFKYRDKLKCLTATLMTLMVFHTLPRHIEAQTRDPRFYSRVGVDYQWPSPGDPDYR